MPTLAAQEAVKVGCGRLQQRCREQALKAYSSCREDCSVLSSSMSANSLQAAGTQQSSAELVAVHSRVLELYKELQELRQTFAAEVSNDVDTMGAPSQDDQAEHDALLALIEHTKELEQLLTGVQQLKPQLGTQGDADPASQQGEGTASPAWDSEGELH